MFFSVGNDRGTAGSGSMVRRGVQRILFSFAATGVSRAIERMRVPVTGYKKGRAKSSD